MTSTPLIESENFSGKGILITGGAGFIGSSLAQRLVEYGARVALVDILDPDTGANLFNLSGFKDKVQLTLADITDERIMVPLIKDRDYLFNLAGLSSHLGSTLNPFKDLEANVTSQLKFLEMCRINNPSIRIVFASTRQVYGVVEKIPVNERQSPSPIDHNGVSKLAASYYHILYHKLYGMWTSTLRMTNVYGPRMRVKDDHQNFLGWWIRLLLEGKELPVYGDGRRIRDFNFVDDVVEALLLAMVNPAAKGQIYNLGAQPVSLVELANLLVRLNGSGAYRMVPLPKNRSKIDIGDYAGDYSKIKRQLGWEPRTGLEEGIVKTLEYYRQFGDQYYG